MMEQWREEMIVGAIKSRIRMYRDLREADEKDIEWAKESELPELENWFTGRTKGYASAQNVLRDILNMFPGEGDA